MYTNQKPFFIRVLTPLHAGTGSDIGIIDMPIQRERHTNFPKIESSGLKGSLREYFEATLKEDRKDEKINLVFGPDNDKNAHAAAFALTDAAVLFFPVKSAKGVYALITCPSALKRFFEFAAIELGKAETDAEAKAERETLLKTIKEDVAGGECIVADGTTVAINSDSVVLEEYAFKINDKKLKIEKNFKFVDQKRIVCVSDDVFRDFVTLSTELITRNRVSAATGTVENGALFSEEFLPPETILYSFLQTGPVNHSGKDKDGKAVQLPLKEQKDVETFLKKYFPDVFQIGGDATIGKGIVKIYGIKEA